MKEGVRVPDNDSSTLPGGDIPASWGFHLLQELRRMEDRLESKIDGTNARIDSTHARINALETTMEMKFVAQDAKIDTLRREMDQKLDGLRYWSWASLIAVIVAAVTLVLLHRP